MRKLLDFIPEERTIAVRKQDVLRTVAGPLRELEEWGEQHQRPQELKRLQGPQMRSAHSGKENTQTSSHLKLMENKQTK